MLLKALELYGTKETAGAVNNPVILSWALECGLPSYKADSTPWCGLFMAVVCLRSGKKIPANALWAKSWLAYGEKCEPELGCIMVFDRKPQGGHVGIYIGESEKYYYILAGNQGDKVCIVPIDKERFLGARCQYNIKPHNVRKVFLSHTGEVSTNEA